VASCGSEAVCEPYGMNSSCAAVDALRLDLDEDSLLTAGAQTLTLSIAQVGRAGNESAYACDELQAAPTTEASELAAAKRDVWSRDAASARAEWAVASEVIERHAANQLLSLLHERLPALNTMLTAELPLWSDRSALLERKSALLIALLGCPSNASASACDASTSNVSLANVSETAALGVSFVSSAGELLFQLQLNGSA
jgi:hypothetical protein